MARVWSTPPEDGPEALPRGQPAHRVLHLAEGDDPASQQERPQAVIGVGGGREDEATLLHRHPDPGARSLEPDQAGPAPQAEVLEDLGDVALGQRPVAHQRRLRRFSVSSTSAAARRGTRSSWCPVSR